MEINEDKISNSIGSMGEGVDVGKIPKFRSLERELKISEHFDSDSDLTIYNGDCKDLMKEIPSNTVSLIVTSPPYNIGKEYEKKVDIEIYKKWHKDIIFECYRILREDGSIFWEVGNYVKKGEIYPLDVLLYPIFKELKMKLRNRIIWYFRHGLHCSKRFSGRYETILWFTKSDNYIFNLDDVRVPQLYPKKRYYKGPNKGKISSNPKGKNPTDVWEIPNVKHNHPEKTIHPCQYPEALIDRIIKATTNRGDWVFDPFLGSGTTAVVALRLNRKAIGAEIKKEYVDITWERINKVLEGLSQKKLDLY